MKVITALTILSLFLSACACEGKIDNPLIPEEPEKENTNPSDEGSENNNPVTEPFSIQYTTPVPGEFFQTAARQGRIELLEYDSKDYTSSSRPATRKPAYVYLPYGYDASKKYDVIYLLHGWTGVAQEYFLGRGGNSRTGLVNIFDNLIQQGLTRPFIAVSPTWYNHIDPDKTVEIVNTLKSRADAGKTVFLDIYTDAEKQADPAKRNTGLFFFQGDKGAKTAICNAGGGFAYVGAMHDSFPHALELSKKGYNAFALIYRPGWDTAMEDLARTIGLLVDNAEELGISMDGYSLWGGSRRHSHGVPCLRRSPARLRPGHRDSC